MKTVRVIIFIGIGLLTACSPGADLVPTIGPLPVIQVRELDRDYTEVPRLFDEDIAQEHVKYLASDDLEGRLIGTEGGISAGDYIAEQFEAYGLLPGGVDSSYFQPFTTEIDIHVDQPELSITSPPGLTYITHDDYSPRIGGYRGNGEVTNKVVWLGDCRTFDVDINLQDTIVLCWSLSGGELEQALLDAKDHKIGGLLMITEQDAPYLRSGYGYGRQIDFPVFSIPDAIAADLLIGSEYVLEDLDTLVVPSPLITVVHMESSYATIDADGRNVLGLLPGADPELKDEVVIIGAHYDHVGMDPDGTIYNGANDNASGVAVVLEIARLWDAENINPPRSVLFVAWDGEEMGLKGASYYVSEPIFPLDMTVAYLNVDCVGVGDTLFIYGLENDLVDQLEESAGNFGYAVNLNSMSLGDDRPFDEAGINAASLMVNPDDSQYYPQLHRPDDDPRIIQTEWLREVGILSAYTLYFWAMSN